MSKTLFIGRVLRAVVDNSLDGDIVVSKFEFQSRYYLHFWTDTLKKGMNSLIPPAMD